VIISHFQCAKCPSLSLIFTVLLNQRFNAAPELLRRCQYKRKINQQKWSQPHEIDSTSPTNGNDIAAEDMFGQPPFVTEGFTLEEPDGRVLFYFSQPGESIVDLRKELQDQPG